MTEPEAQQIFDGVMLGDAGLTHRGRGAYFYIGLSGRRSKPDELLTYLQHVKSALEVLGAEACTGHPKPLPRSDRGRAFTLCFLATRVSPFLERQYKKWYGAGGKEVPEDLSLTPVSLADWFMNDGSSSRDNRCRTVNTRIHTYGFNLHSIELLEAQLLHLGLSTGRTTDKTVVEGAGVAIDIAQGSVDRFMELVEPYMFPAYLYKVKYRGMRSWRQAWMEERWTGSSRD